MLLLVGAYTIDMGDHAPGKARGISAYDFIPGEGRLEFRGYVPTVNPSYLWVDNLRKLVYAVRECPEQDGPGVVAYYLSRGKKREIIFTQVSDVNLNGDHPCHLVGVEDTLIVSSYTSGTIDVFAKNQQGRIGALLQHIKLPSAGAERAPLAHCATFDPKRNRIYICDLGGDRLRVFNRRPDGTLDLLPQHGIDFPDGAGPRHIALHPGGDFAVVVCEHRGITVLVDLRGDKPVVADQTYYLPERVSDQASGAAIRMDRQGKYVYVSDRSFSVITSLRLDTKELRFLPRDTYPSGGERPRDVVLSADGNWLLAGNLKGHSIGLFRIQSGGALQLYNVVKKIPSPTCLKWMAV